MSIFSETKGSPRSLVTQETVPIVAISWHIPYTLSKNCSRGVFMAKLIPTGKHEAIQLKCLRSEQIIEIDDAACEVNEKYNGLGFAEFILALKRGVFDLVKVCELRSLRPKKKTHAA